MAWLIWALQETHTLTTPYTLRDAQMIINKPFTTVSIDKLPSNTEQYHVIVFLAAAAVYLLLLCVCEWIAEEWHILKKK